MSRGTCVTVPVGAPGADAAFPPHPAVWTQDFVWMGRYVSSPDGNSKNLKQAEIDQIAEADGAVAWFVEQSETTVINGDTGNRTLARQATKLAYQFDLPAGCPFWYAVDINPAGRFDIIARAFEVYREETPDQWPIAGYVGSACGDFLLERGLIEYLHLPAATSWWGGYLSPHASLRQYPSQPYAGTRIDRNDTLKPVPMWFPGRDDLDTEEDVPLTPAEIDAIATASATKARDLIIGDPKFQALYQLLGIAAKNPDGTDVWRDPQGAPMPMPWNLGYIWQKVQEIRERVDGSVLTQEDIDDAVRACLWSEDTDGGQQAMIRAGQRVLADETIVGNAGLEALRLHFERA